MFLVYPIRPHFLGHNFLSLNPSISDKKNIQTLGGDSVVTLCRGPAVPVLSYPSYSVFQLKYHNLGVSWCWGVLAIPEWFISNKNVISCSESLYKWILLSYDVVITVFVVRECFAITAPSIFVNTALHCLGGLSVSLWGYLWWEALLWGRDSADWWWFADTNTS